MSPAAHNIDKKYYRKTRQSEGGTVDLDTESARVYAVLEENIQLSKVAELAGVSMAGLWKSIAKLKRMGLIEDADGDAGTMGRMFVDLMQREFAKSVGPISSILLEKVASQMDVSLPDIPVERARELVSILAEKIPDEKASADFQRILLQDL